MIIKHLIRALHQVLADAEVAGQSRVVVLRGAGGHFCAGADLKGMANARLQVMRAATPAKDADATTDVVGLALPDHAEFDAWASAPDPWH